MKEYLAIGGVFLTICLSTFGIVMVAKAPVPPAGIPATCRSLAADPEFYRDQTVILPSEGLQPTENPKVFVYRHLANSPPIVTCEFESIPTSLPAKIEGHCEGKRDQSVLVLQCHPHP